MPVTQIEARGIGVRIRTVEWVVAGFFLYCSVLALILPISNEIRTRTLSVNGGVLLLLVLVIASNRDRLRDWFTMALILLAYQQMGCFAPSIHYHRLEKTWIVWDRLVLRDWGVQRAIEMAGPLLPNVLELSYLVVYAIGPFTVVMLYLYGSRRDVEVFLLIYILGLFLSYGQFPFWPSEPPRTVYPGDLEPARSLLRQVNLRVLGNAGIHTSVFPSAHVSGVFAAAFAIWRLLPERRVLRYGLVVYANLVAVATFYGRYHYLIDAVAGVAVAVAAMAIGWALTRGSRLPHGRGTGPLAAKDKPRHGQNVATVARNISGNISRPGPRL